MNKTRIIIELAGGLGNQMFQYAFYLKMKSLGYDCQLYFDEAHTIHNGPELNKVFGIELIFRTCFNHRKIIGSHKKLNPQIKKKNKGK